MKTAFTIRRQHIDGALAFLRVAEHRNFRVAARELGISPSALSQTVRNLEANLGVAQAGLDLPPSAAAMPRAEAERAGPG